MTDGTLLSRFSEFVTREMGLHFPRNRQSDLLRGTRAAANEFGFDDPAECMRWLMSSKLTRSQIETLASALTVGETYFFREPKVFDILERELLPELATAKLRTGGRLRLWSAACCSGEEPYSLAISLTRSVPSAAYGQPTILGSDINPRFLKKGLEGKYGEWSFRNAPDWLRARHFKMVTAGRWEISSDIKTLVRFSHLNLAEDVYPSLVNNTSAIDVVFCRNVLIYFEPVQARKVIQSLHRCLTEGGWLVLSPSEASNLKMSQFVPVSFDGTVLFRKDGKRRVALSKPLLQPAIPECVDLQPTLNPALPIAIATPAKQVPEPEDTSPVSYNRAESLYERGDFNGVVEELTSLPDSMELGFDAMMLLVRAMANLGNLDEARAWCNRIIALDSLDATTHYLLASIVSEQGDLDEAARSFKRAIYLEPDFVLAHFALGNLERSQGRLQKARKHFQNALAIINKQPKDSVLAGSEGLTAGRLSQIIAATLDVEEVAPA